MKSIDIVVQSLPPVHDAIGEYTAFLSSELGKTLQVRLLTSSNQVLEAIDGVAVEPCFSLQGRLRFAGLRQTLVNTDADAVVLQYNPFAWGRRGWAPDLVSTLKTFKQHRPEVQLGVMFHETYTMSPGWRAWCMRQYQLRQFRRLAEAADVCFFSTERWAEHEKSRRPNAEVFHIPVGANLPLSTADRFATREKWGLEPVDFVCGTFGGAHPSRMLPWICHAANRLADIRPGGRRVVFLHVGGEEIDWSDITITKVVTGRLCPQEAADAIAVMDLMINPFTDGISTRRGSAIAGLQQGVPVITTRTNRTDCLWMGLADRAVFLSDPQDIASWNNAVDRVATSVRDDAEGTRAAAFSAFDEYFSWPKIAQMFTQHPVFGSLAAEAVGDEESCGGVLKRGRA